MSKTVRAFLALFLAVCLTSAVLPAERVEAASPFTIRTTCPSYDNPYYFSRMNPFYAAGYGMPNCTAYAYGRVYEILGYKPNLSVWSAGQWWFDNINYGWYSYGSVPAPGAVACWDKWDGVNGHVAVVEEVYSDGTVLMSESSWSGRMFNSFTMRWDSSDELTNYRFLGYIYPLGNAGAAPSGGSAPSGSGSSTYYAPKYYAFSSGDSFAKTVARLGTAANLSLEEGGNVIARMQTMLLELGFDCGKVDGVYGKYTRQAITKYQEKKGLKAEGYIDLETWIQILNDYNVLSAASENGDDLPVEALFEDDSEEDLAETVLVSERMRERVEALKNAEMEDGLADSVRKAYNPKGETGSAIDDLIRSRQTGEAE